MNRSCATALTALAAVCLTTAVSAQDFPSRPVRLIVPTPAGSGPDADARHIMARVAPLLGQPIVIENRPGAATRIAVEAVAKANPDGHTLLLGTPSLATAPSLYATPPFDARRDLVPVSLLSTTAYALSVNATVPAQTAQAYVTLTRQDNTRGNVATYGLGTVPHLAGAWFAAVSGADLRFIHYNTTPPWNDLLAGQTQAVFDALLPVVPHARAGKLRVLAISGKARQALLPDVPTFAEAGYATFDPLVWVGILAPAGTPRPVIQKLATVLGQVAKSAEIVAYRRDVGSDSVGSTPEEYGAFLDAERAKWAGVITRAGIKLE